MSRTATSNSDSHALRACRDDIYQDEPTKTIKEMADAKNQLTDCLNFKSAKPKNCKILLGKTADVLPMMPY
jgi:hypothetical protein